MKGLLVLLANQWYIQSFNGSKQNAIFPQLLKLQCSLQKEYSKPFLIGEILLTEEIQYNADSAGLFWGREQGENGQPSACSQHKASRSLVGDKDRFYPLSLFFSLLLLPLILPPNSLFCLLSLLPYYFALLIHWYESMCQEHPEAWFGPD